MFKRIGLMLLVNGLVMATVFTLMSVFQVQPYLNQHGLDYGSLMIFCLLWGFGGAFISLLISRWMAKKMMGVQVIDPNTTDPTLRELVNVVHQLSSNAGLTTMPEVGIYESPELNAFATGPSRSRSLVAVSTGLLERMDRNQVEGVLGHEVAHIANGDMVTMTLVQGVVNAFVMFLARVVAFAIMQVARGRDENSSEGFSYLAYHITVFVLEMVFMILGSMVIAKYSRWREYRADSGGANLAGKKKMIAALEGLQRGLEIQDPRGASPAFQSMKISTKGKLSLFSTHPPLEERIERLRQIPSLS